MLKIFNLKYPKIAIENQHVQVTFWTFHIAWPFTQYAKISGKNKITHRCWFPIGITNWEFNFIFPEEAEVNLNIEVGKCQI